MGQKRKVNFNTAVDRIYYDIQAMELCDKASVLAAIAKHTKADATHAQGVPNPTPTPPGSGTGKG
jgi:hypothetical protein